jgi:two-component system sensor histidine kinase/response regulator
MASDGERPIALDIAGLDTQSAIQRIGDNRKRYESVLRDFVVYESSVIDKIAAALKAGDTFAAHLAAHSLKGSAGIIGATNLALRAQALESYVRKH